MLLSLAVYVLSGAALFAMGWHVAGRDERARLQGGAQLPFLSWEIVASILLVAVIAGLRYHTGFDHAMYLKEYQILQQTGSFGRTSFEPGFVLISKLFAWMHCHYSIYFGFWGALNIGFVYFALRDRKWLLPWMGAAIMLGGHFVLWTNLLRQYVVVCAFVAMIPLMQQRKFWHYLAAVLACCLIHRTAVLLLPVYFLNRTNIHCENRKWYFAIVAVTVVVGLYPFWLPLLDHVRPFLTYIGYGRYNSFLVDDMVRGDYVRMHWGPNRIALVLQYCFILWYANDLKRYFAADKLLPLYFTLLFVGICMESVLLNTRGDILRLAHWFLVFLPIVDSYLMVWLWRTGRKWQLAAMAAITFTYTIVQVLKACYVPTSTNTQALYHLFFAPTL